MEYDDFLKHYGVKGMKWGVRKAKDEINSRDRTIKRGTEFQTITSQKYDSKKSNRLYTAYTQYDKDEYVSLMGNFMYEGKGYTNTFLATKDIKVASDKATMDAFVSVVKKDPERVIKDMTLAYNTTHAFKKRSEKYYAKKLKDLNDSDSMRAQKLAKDFITNTVMIKEARASADTFYGELLKKGYDAISDANDRDGGAKDPLIIINLNSVNHKISMELTKKELDLYWRKNMEESHTKQSNDLSDVQR